MARETEPRTALGTWLWAKVTQRGFRRRLDFIRELGYSASTVNDWTRASVASVPERKAVAKIADVLKLNREEREELQELVDEQERRAGQPRERVVEMDPTASRAPIEPEAGITRTGPGRWQRYAERYWQFSTQATVALARGVPPAALDAASDYLGAQKGDGPTEADASAAIKRYARQITAEEPTGHEASDDEFEVPKVTAKRGKR